MSNDLRDPVQEAELVDSPAIRVTLDDVENNIVTEVYLTGYDAAKAAALGGEIIGDTVGAENLKYLTLCILVLKNGFTILGESACASPENFNPQIGKRLARADAVNKIWPLMGYELKQRIFKGKAQ